MIKLELKYLDKKIQPKKIFDEYKEKVLKIHDDLNNKKVKGAEMTGWMEYPFDISEQEINYINRAAKEWKKMEIKNVLLIGIGGSYIGTRAAIEMATPYFGRDINFYYLQNISSSYIESLKKELSKKDFAIIICSKSGTTLEPSLGLRIFYKLLSTKYGKEEANKRVYAITDSSKGTLFSLAKKQGWKMFSIPDNVGGRFSAITPIGLLPCAVAGIDIKSMIEGFRKALKDTNVKDISKNSSYQYAILRNYINTKLKKDVEVFSSYEPQLFFFTEHLKQLFAESEGKEGKGLMPMAIPLTTDLHSVGQYLQEGKKFFFETTLLLENPMFNIKVNKEFKGEDGLSYLDDKSIHEINNIAAISTIESHSIEGNVISLVMKIKELSAYSFGYLYSWFSRALAISGSLLGLNAFNQPGVEAYKKRMFAKLKKIN